jgi:hypothetical protein
VVGSNTRKGCFYHNCVVASDRGRSCEVLSLALAIWFMYVEKNTRACILVQTQGSSTLDIGPTVQQAMKFQFLWVHRSTLLSNFAPEVKFIRIITEDVRQKQSRGTVFPNFSMAFPASPLSRAYEFSTTCKTKAPSFSIGKQSSKSSHTKNAKHITNFPHQSKLHIPKSPQTPYTQKPNIHRGRMVLHGPGQDIANTSCCRNHASGC